MKDFNAWLADTTEYLQEKEEQADFVRSDGVTKWEACPSPCTVCGSAEEVCECEEAEYRRECQGIDLSGGHSHSITTHGDGQHTHGGPFDVQFPRLYRAGLWQDAEGTIPVRKGDPVGRVECPLTGNAMTSPEGSRPTYREPMTATGHALQTYVVRFLQDMAKRRQREGDS